MKKLISWGLLAFSVFSSARAEYSTVAVQSLSNQVERQGVCEALDRAIGLADFDNATCTNGVFIVLWGKAQKSKLTVAFATRSTPGFHWVGFAQKINGKYEISSFEAGNMAYFACSDIAVQHTLLRALSHIDLNFRSVKALSFRSKGFEYEIDGSKMHMRVTWEVTNREYSNHPVSYDYALTLNRRNCSVVE